MIPPIASAPIQEQTRELLCAECAFAAFRSRSINRCVTGNGQNAKFEAPGAHLPVLQRDEAQQKRSNQQLYHCLENFMCRGRGTPATYKPVGDLVPSFNSSHMATWHLQALSAWLGIRQLFLGL